MAAAKILVNSESGVGKTSLLASLDPSKTLVISRDSKAFSLPMPHMLVEEFYNMELFLYGGEVAIEGDLVQVEGVVNKMEAFEAKFEIGRGSCRERV